MIKTIFTFSMLFLAIAFILYIIVSIIAKIKLNKIVKDFQKGDIDEYK